MKNKNLFYYIFGQSLSRISSYILDFYIVWSLVIKYNNSLPFIISLLITYIPKVIASYILSNLKIYNKHKCFIILGDTITAIFSLFLIFVPFSNLKLVYIILFLRTIGNGILEPYTNSIIPNIFSEKDFKKVNSINSVINSSISLILPSVTAVALVYIPIYYIAILDVVMAIINITCVSQIKVINIEKNEDETENKKIKLSRLGLKLLVINSIFFFLLSVPGYMTALLVKYVFGNHVKFLTYNETFWCLGMLIGGILVLKIKKIKMEHFKKGIIFFGISIFLLGFSKNIVLYGLIILISGITYPFYQVTSNYIVNSLLSKKENDTYFLWQNTLMNVLTPLGILVFGFILNYIHIDNTFILSGSLITLLGIFTKVV